MKPIAISLDDKYEARQGTVFLTGIQALVRALMDQSRADRLAGRTTGGFVSGYRGSPVGGLDQQLWRAERFLEAHDIRFTPGVNEDTAATAVWGSQQLDILRNGRVEGVFGMWYGKAPGVDRSADALRHANFDGTSVHGGVLAVAGDDHDCKSSTLPSQSEMSLASVEIPFLNPAGVQEVLDYALMGWALSRVSSLWIGLIAIADTMDSGASVLVDPARHRIRFPEGWEKRRRAMDFTIVEAALDKEKRIRRFGIPAAHEMVRLNGLDRRLWPSHDRRLGIVTTGKAYLDVLETLAFLGLDERSAGALGLEIYKVAMPWPLEREGARAFAGGLQKVLVVEHKRPLLEPQLRDALYDLPDGRRPQIEGKRTQGGAPLLADTASLTMVEIARAIASWLPEGPHTDEIAERVRRLERLEARLPELLGAPTRAPVFCSGCPHNTSTNVPEGSQAYGGIGCHSMALMSKERTATFTHMGAEGTSWIGQAPFAKTSHVFVNIGDGTYYHSGILAIRASISAGVNVTYKLLYNDAVAMTGGQPIEGGLSVAAAARQIAAEGAKRIVIVSDTPDIYRADASLGSAGIAVEHRDRLDAVQRELREIPGVTVLIYAQVCAAEKRRRRKRGLMEDPPKRLFINEEVCEGCGDCTVQSNCISVEPLETAFGRKRRINQSACNKDYSCAKGFCPSFVELEGASLKAADADGWEALRERIEALPEPARAAGSETANILIAGIGGTGVTTLSAILGFAAHLDGRKAATLDMTGLAQKGGAVLSHVRLFAEGAAPAGARLPPHGADLLLAADGLVAASEAGLGLLDPERTVTLLNGHIAPTADFLLDNAHAADAEDVARRLAAASRSLARLDAARLAELAFGDELYTNMILLGHAFEMGLVPLGSDAIASAIRLNGVAVEANLGAFGLGRLAAADPAALEAFRARGEDGARIAPRGLEAILAHRSRHLAAYRDEAYAARYRALVARVAAREAEIAPGSTQLAEAAARSYAKLLAYKDEYEVARLYTDEQFRRRLAAQFDETGVKRVLLAPPLLARRDKATGRPQKRAFGPWIFSFFGVLARLKGLRGTPFDPFGRTAERRLERALIAQYEADIARLLAELTPERLGLAAAIAGLPERIRGFGPVKEASAARAAAERERLWTELAAVSRPPSARAAAE
ncbi:MAG: indolepyruvate ferredoxin oxidoreductase family protein [Alphaproteobacteria bacterium]|nr:indolepyruvate ferredoxin oxidoreductase family protein [Alphaproteobacteria bacterium]